jgi:hypothetical protein
MANIRSAAVARSIRRKTELRAPVDKERRFNELWIEAERLRLDGVAPTQIAHTLHKSEAMISQYRTQLASVADSVKWAYGKLSSAGYYEKKAREFLPYATMSATAHQAKWEALKMGFWLFEKGALPLGYRLGPGRKIELHPKRSKALKAALLKITKGWAISKAASQHGFKPASLRHLVKHPEFQRGLVHVPGKEGAVEWIEGKQPVLVSDELLEQLRGRPGTMFQVPLTKIKKIFRLRAVQIRRKQTSLKKIGLAVGLPWQTVADLVKNPRSKDIVGEAAWRAVQTIPSS